MLQPPISSLFETSSQNVDLSVERRILDERCQRLSQKVEFRIRFRIRSSIFRCPTLFRTRPLRTSAFYLRILIEPLKLIPVDGFCPKKHGCWSATAIESASWNSVFSLIESEPSYIIPYVSVADSPDLKQNWMFARSSIFINYVTARTHLTRMSTDMFGLVENAWNLRRME